MQKAAKGMLGMFPTLILLVKNFSKSFQAVAVHSPDAFSSLGSMMLSSAGCWQSTVNFTVSASQQGRSLRPALTSWRQFPSSS